MNTLGDRLRLARERIRLSQTEVCRRIKINNKTLSRYEKNGSEPDIETLKSLAAIYDVSVDWLTGNDLQNKPTKDQAKNAVMEIYTRLPLDKKKIIDDLIKALEQQQ